MKVLVVGAGISGATISRLLAEDGNKVFVYERNKYIGGCCYDKKFKDFYVSSFGPHIFHTNNKDVWDFVNRFCDFNLYMHKVKAYIDGHFVSIPFNIKSVFELYPDAIALKILKNKKKLSDFIKNKVFVNYSKKMWGIHYDEIDKKIFDRIKSREDTEDRYFTDKYQGMPKNGYTNLIKNILKHKNIIVRKNKNANIKDFENFDIVIYTGELSSLFGFKVGILPYRTIKFTFEKSKLKNDFSVINYPNDGDFTRQTDYSIFYDSKSKTTIKGLEYPFEYDYKDKNQTPLYPIQNEKYIGIYNKMVNMLPKNVFLLGRLGTYKYLNMDKAIEQAINLHRKIKNEEK